MNMPIVDLGNLGKLLRAVSQIKTPSFVRIENYSNEKGEVANYTINLGVSYENAKESDTKYLSNELNIIDTDFGSVKEYAKEAWSELLIARTKPTKATINRSNGQSDAYTTICPNVRVHNETGRIFIYGFVVKKDVILEGSGYDSVNSSPLTIAKRKIEKNLKATNFRQLAFDKLDTVKVKGEELIITIG
jgi:hypothetical protein